MNHARIRRLSFVATAVIAGLVVTGCGGGGGTTAASSAIGAPGDPARSSRTVEVRAGDDLHFQPDQLAVKAGETVTFKVVNAGKVDHEFTVGDASAQAAHEKRMRSASGSMSMGADPNAIDVAPGETKELTWTFAKAGTTLYGCHEPGHYAGGMKGTLTAT